MKYVYLRSSVLLEVPCTQYLTPNYQLSSHNLEKFPSPIKKKLMRYAVHQKFLGDCIKNNS